MEVELLDEARVLTDELGARGYDVKDVVLALDAVSALEDVTTVEDLADLNEMVFMLGDLGRSKRKSGRQRHKGDDLFDLLLDLGYVLESLAAHVRMHAWPRALVPALAQELAVVRQLNSCLLGARVVRGTLAAPEFQDCLALAQAAAGGDWVVVVRRPDAAPSALLSAGSLSPVLSAVPALGLGIVAQECSEVAWLGRRDEEVLEVLAALVGEGTTTPLAQLVQAARVV